jgi:hypothetical protein
MRLLWDILNIPKWQILDACACCSEWPKCYIRKHKELDEHYEIECPNEECANLIVHKNSHQVKIDWNVEQRVRSGRIQY